MKHDKMMNVNVKLMRFLEHDETHEVNISYDFSDSWRNRKAGFSFQLLKWPFSYSQQN